MAEADTDSVDGCIGACCAGFYLSRTITDQRRNAAKIMDGEFIADMLIPLSPKEAKDRIRDSGGKIGLKEEFAWKNRGHHFTCKHWDKDSKQCTAYERRPNMCRKYPYGTKCHKCGIVAGVPLGD